MQALKLADKYLQKAVAADRRQGVKQGEVGRVESKLVGMGTTLRRLVAAMANRHVRVARPSRGRRGRMRGEEAEC